MSVWNTLGHFGDVLHTHGETSIFKTLSNPVLFQVPGRPRVRAARGTTRVTCPPWPPSCPRSESARLHLMNSTILDIR